MWLDEHLPAVKATLRPGVSKKDLEKFEKAIGQQLPDDVRESWMIHDGQGCLPDDFDTEEVEDQIPDLLSLFFGVALNPLITSKKALSPRAVLPTWTDWTELIEGGEPGSYEDIEKYCSSSPVGAIQCRYFHRGWIPLATWVDSDYVGIDFDPGPNGVVGQVVNFGRNEEKKYVLAKSWAQFLEDFADELEAGNFVIDFDRECEEFLMKNPEGPLVRNYKAWSEAKLPYDFPAR
ncbi:SMI1/KNR4 family protein [Singulisphaera acidiphila]|uniref:SMI1/KNR4 family protein n=1 Tax=Singulisphaera acidiphila TaxID=466153 RepID=UPI0002F17271|nr:SMI1/KNR4 family protein [Singulisphaera acidiphila]